MHQNPSLNKRLQQLREGNPTFRPSSDHSHFPAPASSDGKLCLVWEDGDMMLFLYRDFMTARYKSNSGENTLTLKFISDKVILKGYNLAVLFLQFWHNAPSVISIINPRYADISNSTEFAVTDAIIE